jgi:hypothetical protein
MGFSTAHSSSAISGAQSQAPPSEAQFGKATNAPVREGDRVAAMESSQDTGRFWIDHTKVAEQDQRMGGLVFLPAGL